MTDPGQPGTPPSAGDPYPGQPFPPQGALYPGSAPSGATPAGAWQPPAGGPPQPGQPGFGQPQPGQPGPFGGPPPAPAAKPGKGRKIASVVAAVAVAGGIAAFRLVDFGAPEVGDCITAEGASSYETVDCDDSAAQARIVGVVDEKVTESEFLAPSYQPCGDHPSATRVLWNGETGGEGTVFCAEDV
ncbi:LppU/SCO3897 family protein [Geodermatophilus amargosae]|uniref:LppU/SCO3897 family protein n=1 Tax=Geodermatophilus amargosae TaxID=1296565 RepID=UPI0034E03DC9